MPLSYEPVGLGEVLGRLTLWGDPLGFLLVLVLALVLDWAYPFHRGLLLRIHPVHTCYRFALALHRPFSGRAWGLLVFLIVVGAHMVAYALLLLMALVAGYPFFLLASAWVLKVSIGNRLLTDTVRGVGEALAKGNLDEARRLVSGLVRRRVEGLGEGHVASAAVESLGESLVDGLVSPLLYYAFLGPLGALLQRLVNTMDGALGFREPEYREEGWASARADTLMNFLPARLTGLLAGLVCRGGVGGRGVGAFLRCLQANRVRAPSINAGYPMAAFACCLGVVLEKRGSYTLAGGASLPGARDVGRALRLYWVLLVLSVALVGLVGVVLRLL